MWKNFGPIIVSLYIHATGFGSGIASELPKLYGSIYKSALWLHGIVNDDPTGVCDFGHSFSRLEPQLLCKLTLNQFVQKLADTALEAASLPGATLSSVHDALVGCAAEDSTLDVLISKEPTRSHAFAAAVSYDNDDLSPVESRTSSFELDSIDLISPVAPSLDGDNTFGCSHDDLVQATSSAKLRIGSVLLNNYDALAVLGRYMGEGEGAKRGVTSFPKARKGKGGSGGGWTSSDVAKMLANKAGSKCTPCLRFPSFCKGAPAGSSWSLFQCSKSNSHAFVSIELCQVLHHLLRHVYAGEFKKDNLIRGMTSNFHKSRGTHFADDS
jgi:hypothetical protein